jgi:hypothetical protein
MENKYYTPKLGEFFQGFEYQVLRNNNWEKEDLLYSNKYIKVHGFSYLDSLIQGNKVRVKYLDSEDIESLGWKLMDNPSTIGFHFIKDYNRIWLNAENIDNYCKIAKGLNIVFQGIIKNKSEFIKVLKMIEIYGE